MVVLPRVGVTLTRTEFLHALRMPASTIFLQETVDDWKKRKRCGAFASYEENPRIFTRLESKCQQQHHRPERPDQGSQNRSIGPR